MGHPLLSDVLQAGLVVYLAGASDSEEAIRKTRVPPRGKTNEILLGLQAC